MGSEAIAKTIGEAHNLPPERVADLLDERAGRAREFADLLDTGLRHIVAKGVARYFVLDVHYTRALVAAELDWLERTIAELRDGRLTWSTPEGLAAASAHPTRT